MSNTVEQSLPINGTHKAANLKRYLQFALLLVAAGAIYPLLYLRQNFETTILKAFSLTSGELGMFYSTLGVVYAVTYLPSGWLADRVSPRLLIAFSLAAVGALGLWFSTFPSHGALQVIFIGWGLAAGLTFWASLIKGVKMLAAHDEQGRFFGILDGGRGLVEAVLATCAISLFAWLLQSGAAPALALQRVIYMYSFSCIAIGVLAFLLLDGGNGTQEAHSGEQHGSSLWQDLKILLAIPQIWLMALIIFCGYQLFWATYSFSAYLQDNFGMTAVAAGVITVTKLWMRPVGGVGAGFLGDRFSKETVLAASLLFASCSLLALALFPSSSSLYLLLGLVLLIGVLTYAIRGLYWSILDDCRVPARVTGLAIGIISMIGYLPDIFLPMINAGIAQHFPGVLGTQIYFGYIAACGLLGAAVAFHFKQSVRKLENK
ncbi:nitrate/nitrite transporter [Pseudogulbenkiania sp. MAI-1]|uniref:MFS transporter n=1 Tax=Pseudogulbenkiania sp. MAI-1 TaxID=990370 RepID=UPI00045E6AE4|nr:MFS transporter [Pseudogulbenkiania sp. MAI-1]